MAASEEEVVAISATSSEVGGVEADLLDVDFDSYENTSELLNDEIWSGQAYHQDGGTEWFPSDGTAQITLDDSVAVPGHSKTMRYHYNHGSDGCTSITISPGGLSFPENQQEVWSEWLVRWSPNFSVDSPCPPGDHKLIFGDSVAPENGRWEFKVGADSGNLKIAHPDQGQAPYYLDDRSIDANDLWDGEWHTVRLYWRCSTTGTDSDGAYKVWIDGTLYHDETGITIHDGSGGTDRISGVSFCHNKDDGPANTDMYLWWGSIKAYSNDPGW